MTIRVLCDSPRHARGKVATVAEFYRDKAGNWSVGGAVRGRQLARGLVNVSPVGSKDDVVTVFYPRALDCKLCGRQLPGSIPVAVLNTFAAQGTARVTLTTLRRLIASSQR